MLKYFLSGSDKFLVGAKRVFFELGEYASIISLLRRIFDKWAFDTMTLPAILVKISIVFINKITIVGETQMKGTYYDPKNQS